MAYVEWHQEIHGHYKTNHLMRLLSISRREAVGIVGMISAWAVGHRPGGIFEKKLVAVAVEWEKDPDTLVNALLESGWLDEFDKTKVEIHDWESVTTGYRRARKDAKRKRDERADQARAARASKAGRKFSEPSGGSTVESPKPVRGQKRAKTVRGRSKERRAEQTEQTDRTDRPIGAQPRPKGLQQPQETPSSGSSGGAKGPERDADGFVVAVPDRKAPEVTPDRVQKQASIRLGAPLLEAIGMDAQVAASLAAAHPTVRILHVCEHAKKQENPGGFARTALDQGWTVPDSNGAGLAKMMAAIEAEIAAKEEAWDRMGGSSVARKDPEFQRRQGESEDEHFQRVDGLLKKRKSEGKS